MGLEWVFIDTGLGFDMGIVRRELPSSNGTVCIYIYMYIYTHVYAHTNGACRWSKLSII